MDFEKELAFSAEIDKMKSIYRKTLLTDRSRFETDAEHSWHVATLALLFEPQIKKSGADASKVSAMLLVHDLVEIYAGDTFCYDEQAMSTKRQRELEAADRLFALLPPERGAYFRALWDEFEAQLTKESHVALALDCLQPFLNNVATGGRSWKAGGVTVSMLMTRLQNVRAYLPDLWPDVERMMNRAAADGQLKKD